MLFKRAVIDSFHLKRIHQMLPNAHLGEALKKRLSAMDPLQADVDVLDTKVLGQLLECLIYFQLSQCRVTGAAVTSVKNRLHSLVGNAFLPSIITACYKLEQHDVTLQFAPHLRKVIGGMSGDDISRVGVAFAAANVFEPDSWQLIAERSMRTIHMFSAEGLLELFTAFCNSRVEYPDFYAVVERHVTAKTAEPFMSIEQLTELEFRFRKLNLPTMNLTATIAERRLPVWDGSSAVGVEDAVNALSKLPRRAVEGSEVMQAFIRNSLNSIANNASFPEIKQIAITSIERNVVRTDILDAAMKRVVHLLGEQVNTSSEDGSPAVTSQDAFDLLAILAGAGQGAILSFDAEALLKLCDAAAPAAARSPLSALRVMSRLRLWPPLPTSAMCSTVMKAINDDSFDSSTMQHGRTVMWLLRVCSVLGASGSEVLGKYIGILEASLARVPLRHAQEVIALLSRQPVTYSTVLKSLLTTIAGTKNWRTILGPRASLEFLEAMASSNVRDQKLVLDCIACVSNSYGALVPNELCRVLKAVSQLQYKDIEFYTLVGKKVLLNPSCSVSDVCSMLYTCAAVGRVASSFAVELLPRLRVSVQSSTCRDVVLALYALATLRLPLHHMKEAIQCLCDHGAAVVAQFKGVEMLSALSSLRTLHMTHEVFTISICDRVAREEGASSEERQQKIEAGHEGPLPRESLLRLVVLLTSLGAPNVAALKAPFLASLLSEGRKLNSKVGLSAMVALAALNCELTGPLRSQCQQLVQSWDTRLMEEPANENEPSKAATLKLSLPAGSQRVASTELLVDVAVSLHRLELAIPPTILSLLRSQAHAFAIQESPALKLKIAEQQLTNFLLGGAKADDKPPQPTAAATPVAAVILAANDAKTTSPIVQKVAAAPPPAATVKTPTITSETVARKASVAVKRFKKPQRHAAPIKAHVSKVKSHAKKKPVKRA